MRITKRTCVVGITCTVSCFVAIGLASRAYGHRRAGVTASRQQKDDPSISRKEKDLLRDLIQKIKNDKDPLKDLPSPEFRVDLPHSPTFSSDAYIRAAVALQAASREDVRKSLLSLARQGALASVSILCRMLFVGKDKEPLAELFFGQNFFPGGTSPEEWSLNPIALVDGVPFFLPRTIFIAGHTTPPVEYVKYCFRDGDWNPYRFHLKTAHQKQAALKKLFASRKWKRPLYPEEQTFLANQIR